MERTAVSSAADPIVSLPCGSATPNNPAAPIHAHIARERTRSIAPSVSAGAPGWQPDQGRIHTLTIKKARREERCSGARRSSSSAHESSTVSALKTRRRGKLHSFSQFCFRLCRTPRKNRRAPSRRTEPLYHGSTLFSKKGRQAAKRNYSA